MPSLEPAPDEMRAIIAEVGERIVRYIDSLPRQKVSDTSQGHDVARSVRRPFTEEGTALDPLLDLLFDEAIPPSFNTASPGYLAFIPGGGLFDSAVADFMATAVNRYVGVCAAAPALVEIEMNVIRWFCEIVSLPPGSGGFLTTGGSQANLSALVAARTARLGDDFSRGVIYCSDQIHHSVTKAARIAGFSPNAIRLIPTDGRRTLDCERLRDAVSADRRTGRIPFLVAASAGTTNTGAIDDLERIADLALEESLWLHVDAAYGGFFALTERGRERLRGIGRADSITLDPHKGLFLPYGTGSILVRDVATLRAAFSSRADYMPPMQDEDEFVDFCEISPELSRDFRGLRVWLPVALRGVAEFRRQLDEKLDLTLWITERLRERERLEVTTEPELSIVTFRVRHSDRDRRNDLTRRLMAEVNRRQRVFLTGTRLDGDFVIRICVLSFRTHLDRMEMALEDLDAALGELGAE